MVWKSLLLAEECQRKLHELHEGHEGPRPLDHEGHEGRPLDPRGPHAVYGVVWKGTGVLHPHQQSEM